MDTEGRVHGAERLSVVDASIMPDVPSGVYALSDDHDRGALIREASGLRLVRPFSKPFWTFAGAQNPGTRRIWEDPEGHEADSNQIRADT